MITCVSLRSGMASSGTVRIDHRPATTDVATSRKTRNRLRAENSMMRLIMVRLRALRALRRDAGRRVFVLRGRRAEGVHCGAQLTFGIHQECSGRYDALAHAQAPGDRDAVAEPLANLHLPRFQIPVAAIDEDRLTVP